MKTFTRHIIIDPDQHINKTFIESYCVYDNKSSQTNFQWPYWTFCWARTSASNIWVIHVLTEGLKQSKSAIRICVMIEHFANPSCIQIEQNMCNNEVKRFSLSITKKYVPTYQTLYSFNATSRTPEHLHWGSSMSQMGSNNADNSYDLYRCIICRQPHELQPDAFQVHFSIRVSFCSVYGFFTVDWATQSL